MEGEEEKRSLSLVDPFQLSIFYDFMFLLHTK